MNLCMVNQLQRLGLAEHFVQETEKVLAKVYRLKKRNIIDIMLSITDVRFCLFFQLLANTYPT